MLNSDSKHGQSDIKLYKAQKPKNFMMAYWRHFSVNFTLAGRFFGPKNRYQAKLPKFKNLPILTNFLADTTDLSPKLLLLNRI